MAKLFRVRRDFPMDAALYEGQLVLMTDEGERRERNGEAIVEVVCFEYGVTWHVKREQITRVSGKATITVETPDGEKHWGIDNA